MNWNASADLKLNRKPNAAKSKKRKGDDQCQKASKKPLTKQQISNSFFFYVEDLKIANFFSSIIELQLNFIFQKQQCNGGSD